MQINLKHIAGISVFSFLIGGALVYKFMPNGGETITKEVIKTDVVTVTREVIKPDGTKETVTTSTDKSVSRASSDVKLPSLVPQWHISASAVVPKSGPYQPVYGLQIEKRILLGISAGIRAQTDGQLGVVVGIEF